jgi:hypothetical protein
MTDTVEDMLQNGKTPDNKKKMKRLKSNLDHLEQAQSDGSVFNKIKRVTAGGAKLVGAEPLCSQDVIDRVEILNSDLEEDDE